MAAAETTENLLKRIAAATDGGADLTFAFAGLPPGVLAIVAVLQEGQRALLSEARAQTNILAIVAGVDADNYRT